MLMIRVFVILLAVLPGVTLRSQGDALFPERSPRAKISQRVGVTDVTVDYGRPRVNGRVVWGDLVPYGMRWRAGANKATMLTFSGPVSIYGHRLPAGTFSFYVIPEKDQWTLIFDRRASVWGAGEVSSPQDEVLRIYRRPRQISQFTEWLTYDITPTSASSAYVTLNWERLEVDFLVEVDVDTYIGPRIKRLLSSPLGKQWEPYADGAFYLWEHGRDLEKALELANRAIKVQENPRTLYVKAQILRDTGDPNQAWALMNKADKLAQTTKSPAKWAYPIQEALARWNSTVQGQGSKARSK